MRIRFKTLIEIFKQTKDSTHETGGILGSQNDIIEYVVFDNGLNNLKCTYEPNVDLLNNAIKIWQENNIEFIGMFHIHFFNIETLSSGDMDYIKKILSAMPEPIDRLYFPLVLPESGVIIPYVALKTPNGINIYKDNLQVIKEN